MIRRPPRSTLDRSSAASDVYKRQGHTADVFEQGSKNMGDVKLVELDNTGHMLQIEKADEFNQAVLDFLK